MSKMREPSIPVDNIRSLLQFVIDSIDDRLQSFLKGTRYETVRPSDIRVFALAQREPRKMADLARMLKVSRQAVQMSVKRLQELKVVELQPVPGNHRDKLVVLTDRGRSARNSAEEQLARYEGEIVSAIGKDGLETLRVLLIQLSKAYSNEEFLRNQNHKHPVE